MSRTFAKLELTVTKNGNQIKTFTQDVSSANGRDKEISNLLGALQKTKDSSNDFLTTLVEQDKANGSGGSVTSHSKRKHDDDGKFSITFHYFPFFWANSIDLPISSLEANKYSNVSTLSKCIWCDRQMLENG